MRTSLDWEIDTWLPAAAAVGIVVLVAWILIIAIAEGKV